MGVVHYLIFTLALHVYNHSENRTTSKDHCTVLEVMIIVLVLYTLTLLHVHTCMVISSLGQF